MKNLICFFTIMLTVLLFSCSPKLQDTVSREQSPSGLDSQEMKIDNNNLNREFPLEIYLRRTPGVSMHGSGANAQVIIRGINSFNQITEPLFIVNGNPVGNTYSRAANILRGMEIESVQVLKGSDAAFYGVRGAAGVVVVKAR